MSNPESIRLKHEAYTTVRAWNYDHNSTKGVLSLIGTVFSASANMTPDEMDELAAQLTDAAKQCRERSTPQSAAA